MKLILGNYSGIAISISGGKDSQTILGVMASQAKEQNYGGKLIAIHADTGAEWPQSLPHCRMLCEHYGIPLYVATPFRSLPDHIEKRCRDLAAHGRKGGWPSPACRYCTSDCKRNPIQKVIRREFPGELGSLVLSVTGERREESSHRAKLDATDVNKNLTTKARRVTNHRPILDMKLPEVWEFISRTGLPRHVAYDRGNERLSCAMCVLAKDSDIRNGAVAVPELAARFLQIERDTGHTFKNGKSLATILGKAMFHA